MLFSTNTHIAVNRDGIGLERGLEMLLDAGFPALDISFFKDIDYVMADDYKENARRIKNLVNSRGAVFNQAHAPFGPYAEYVSSIIPKFPRIIEFAGLIGVKSIVVHPVIPGRHYGNEQKHFEENMAFYSSLAPHAKNAGIKIAIENMWNRHPISGIIEDSVCADPHELARYYDELSDPSAFTVCLDLGHVAICGREPEDAVRIIGGERLGAIHAHDVDYRNDVHTLPGVMNINYDKVCRALADIDYKGDFTLEADNFPRGFDVEYLPTVYRFMADTARFWAQKTEAYKNAK